MFQQPQPVGGDGPAQPDGRGWRLGDHGRRLAVRQTEGTVLGERFDTVNRVTLESAGVVILYLLLRRGVRRVRRVGGVR